MVFFIVLYVCVLYWVSTIATTNRSSKDSWITARRNLILVGSETTRSWSLFWRSWYSRISLEIRWTYIGDIDAGSQSPTTSLGTTSTTTVSIALQNIEGKQSNPIRNYIALLLKHWSDKGDQRGNWHPPPQQRQDTHNNKQSQVREASSL